MNDQDSAIEATDAQQPLPGRALRQAREQQGLTLGEVSGALKFSIRQIEALENDDFQKLQGKTFLRGFIRAYARLLKLPPDPLLAMLGEETSPPSEQIAVPTNMGETDPVPLYRRHARKLGYTVALLLLLAGGIFWFSDLQHQVQPVVEVAPMAAPADVHPEQAPNALHTTEVLPLPTLQPIDSETTLSFEFSGRSWLEVKDASGQVLLTGEFPDGQKQVVTGKPPYQIWVGKVSAVKVNYGGHDVDLQPHARADVARFTLE